MITHCNIVPAFNAIGFDGSALALQIDFANLGELKNQYVLSQVKADGTLDQFACAASLTDLYAQFPHFAAQVPPAKDLDGLH